MSDISYLTCRPVDWSKMGHWAAEIPESNIYPGSIISQCVTCGLDIYIGPKMQKLLEIDLDNKPHCFLCAVKAMEANPGPHTVTHLGNTYQRQGEQ